MEAGARRRHAFRNAFYAGNVLPEFAPTTTLHPMTFPVGVSNCVPPKTFSMGVNWQGKLVKVNWLGFKKAYITYTERINLALLITKGVKGLGSSAMTRMDVTLLCAKDDTLCCNGFILATCSQLFFDRLKGKTEEFVTIAVDIKVSIMRHFLDLMYWGETFVRISDVDEVVRKIPIFLNLFQ